MDAEYVYTELRELSKKLDAYHEIAIANKNDIAWLKKIVSAAGAIYTGLVGFIAVKYIQLLGG